MKKLMHIVFIAAVGLQLSSAGAFAADTKASKAVQEEDKQEVKTIFSYKKELGLTDKQTEDIKALVAKLQTLLNEKGKAIGDLRSKLGDMIKNKDNLGTIRSQLRKIADLQVEISYADIETARKIEGALTPSQMKKWQQIQIASLDKLKSDNQKTEKK